MLHSFFIYENMRNHLGDSWKVYAMMSAGLILAGFLLIVVPELLAYFIASLTLWAGLFLALFAHRLRKAQNSVNEAFMRSFWRN